MILEVFSNLNDSMILCCRVVCKREEHPREDDAGRRSKHLSQHLTQQKIKESMKGMSLGSCAFPPLPHPRTPSYSRKETAATALKDAKGLVLNSPGSQRSQRSSWRGSCRTPTATKPGLLHSQGHAARPSQRTSRDLLQPSPLPGALSKHQGLLKVNSSSHRSHCSGLQKPQHLMAEPGWPSGLCCQDKRTDQSHLSVRCPPSPCCAEHWTKDLCALLMRAGQMERCCDFFHKAEKLQPWGNSPFLL